jgi:hypothetical protein
MCVCAAFSWVSSAVIASVWSFLISSVNSFFSFFCSLLIISRSLSYSGSCLCVQRNDLLVSSLNSARLSCSLEAVYDSWSESRDEWTSTDDNDGSRPSLQKALLYYRVSILLQYKTVLLLWWSLLRSMRRRNSSCRLLVFIHYKNCAQL